MKDGKQKSRGKGSEEASYRGFEALNPKISEGSLDFIQNRLGFRFMSPVQEVTIPELLTHKDVAVEACTGSGKTMSYLVPVVEILLKSTVQTRGISSFNMGSLILTPTRELSMQVFEILERYLETVSLHKRKGTCLGSDLKCLICIGGGNVGKTLEYIKKEADEKCQQSLSRYHVLVGTPGRVFHLFENLKDGIDWNIKSTLEILVLDEADRLLDMGFENHINMILHSMPKQRRTGLFSATLNAQVQNLIKTGLRNPKYIKVSIASCGKLGRNEAAEQQDPASPKEDAECDISVPMGLTCYYAELSPLQKVEFLVRFLVRLKEEVGLGRQVKCIIFFLTCNSVEFYFRYLSKLFHSHSEGKQKKTPKNDYSVDSSLGKLCKLHGQMYQKSREKSYEIFRSCDSGVLISTDLTARGIDIPDIEWIIQFDAPQDPSYYIHRIGRTARAGRLGKSIIMLQPQEGAFIEYIEKKTMRKILSYSHLGEDGEALGGDYNSIDDPSYGGESTDIQLCRCIELNKEIISRDEFLNGSSSKNRVGLRLIRMLMFSDFEFYEKAKSAFVSYIRAYKEYQLPFIFPFKNLSIGEVAASFALLRIPRVKEILGKPIASGKFITGSKNIHPDDFNPNPKAPPKIPDPEATKKRKPRPEDSGKSASGSSKRSRSEKRAAKRKIEMDEWETLQFENNLAKKLKTGKINYKEYQHRLNLFYQDDENSSNHRNDGTAHSDSDSDSATPQSSSHKSNHLSGNNKQKIPKWVIQGKKNKKKR